MATFFSMLIYIIKSLLILSVNSTNWVIIREIIFNIILFKAVHFPLNWVHMGIHETALPHTTRNWIIIRSYQDVWTANAGTIYNIDLLWYCIVHVFVVIHFCDSMWSFWVEANLSLVYICFVVGDSIIQSGMLGSY